MTSSKTGRQAGFLVGEDDGDLDLTGSPQIGREVATAWATELQRRSREIADGHVQSMSWDAARTEILKELEQRRASRASGDFNASRLHDPIANRVAHEIADSAELQLSHDVRAVGFDRLDADSERRRRLFVAPPFGDELNDFALAGRDADWCAIGLRAVFAPDKIVQHEPGDGGRQEGLVLAKRVDGRNQVLVGVGLHDVAACPRP